MSRKGENIHHRKDGRWEGRYASGIKSDGRKKYSSVYAKSYKEVKELLAERKTDAKQEIQKIMFVEAAQLWLSRSKERVKESTFANYTYLLNKHILPFFDKKALDQVSVSVVNNFMDEKLKNGKLKQDKGISRKYMQDILSVIKLIVRFGEDEYKIAGQIDRVKVPKPDKPDCIILTDEEICGLSDYISETSDIKNTAVLISLYTGIRIGEVCGLKWEDYNKEDKTLTIRRTVQRISDNNGHTHIIIGTPKTKSSERVIPIPENICIALDNLKRNGEFIIGTEPRIIRRAFNKILASCGMKPMRYHDLRHSFASWALRKKFDIKALSEILGHANTSMTLNRYVHSNLDIKRKYMNSLID